MMAKKEKKKFSVLRLILGIVLALVAIVVIYFAYVFIAYHRIGDNQKLEVSGSASAKVETGEEYKLISYNIGFGAYEPDYGFFMDGGTESWAWSRERLDANLKKIAQFLGEQNADFYFIQEVDYDSTRTYHVDERVYLSDVLKNYQTTFAINYDSPFLFYPLTQPHGASRSGVMTFSRAPISEAVRRELPIEDSVMKLVDLDRCYSINRVPLANGKELVLFNLHLSAYTSDGKIATEQLNLLLGEMQAEYNKGNYCVAGGDFNKDLLGNSSKYFGIDAGDLGWNQPIPEGTFDKYNISLVGPLDPANPIPSCRNADGPYTDQQYVLTVDGFLVSDNVEVLKSNVFDLKFTYSDHNPVYLIFTLKE